MLGRLIAAVLMGGAANSFTRAQKRENMKRIALAGLVAIALIALSQQQASAWVNQRFGIGINWHRQSGGNNFGWGAYRNGQPPGPESFGGVFSPSAPVSPFFGNAPMPQNFAPQANVPQGYAPQTVYYPPMPAANYAGQYASPYQFANYTRQTYYYSPAPVNDFYFYWE
jgi:hypothetical protein